MVRRFVVLLMVFELIAGPAWAGKADPDLPKPDPKGTWRVVTQDDATSTSQCIGHYDTPLCALDSFLACILRARDDLCRKVRQPDGSFEWPLELLDPDGWQKYRVLSSGRFKVGDSRFNGRYDRLIWAPGDVWIALDERHCDESQCFDPPPRELRYYLRRYILHKRPDGWKVVQGGALYPSQP